MRLRKYCFLWFFNLLSPNAFALSTPGTESSRLVELRQAARGGDTDAKYELGQASEDGKYGLPANVSEAASWYGAAAAAGHTQAQRRLALMHLHGSGVPQSFEEAQGLFFKAAQKGDEVAQYHLGALLLTGKGGQMSVEDAAKWLEKAAEAGHHDAQLELGTLYIKGQHVEVDVDRGLGWVRKAANEGHTPSMYLVATLYEDGQLVPENPEKAKAYFARAADAGFAEAQVWLAAWFERQEPPQYSKAQRYYKIASNQNNANGHFGVARLNLERLLQTPNSQEGLRHLREAVKLNHPEAHYTIGRMYGNGSLTGGSILALEHFQQAANSGNTDAMYQLAVAYYQGTPPVRASPRLAATWWSKAAYAGHIDSQYAFALLHINGIGVSENQGIGFALANIAAAQGHSDASKVRDQLMSSLSPDVLREAQILSVNLFQKVAIGADSNAKALLK